jgi:hypothetical protein
MLTLNAMAWSATSMAAGVELDFAITDDVLRKGIFKFALHFAPLDDCLHPEAPLDDALLHDQTAASGVTPVDGTVVVTGDQ